MRSARGEKRRYRCAGMTMVEVMIAASILAMVFLTAAFILSTTSKQTRLLYGDSRTLRSAHLALDHIRYNLTKAKISTTPGEALDISDENQKIEFTSWWLGPTPGRSAYKFDNGYLQYFKNSSQADPDFKIGPLDDIRFEVLGAGTTVSVTVTTLQTYSWKKDRPYTLVEKISLRY